MKNAFARWFALAVYLCAFSALSEVTIRDIWRWGLLRKTATNGWEVGSHAAFLTSENDTAALSALSAFSGTNKVTVLWESATAWWTVTSNALTRFSVGEGPVWFADFPYGYATGNPESPNYFPVTSFIAYDLPYPLKDGTYQGFTVEGMHVAHAPTGMGGWVEALDATNLQLDGAEGVAYLSITTAVVTNATRFILDDAEGRLLSSFQNGSGFTTQTVHVVAGVVTTNCFYAP